MRIDLQETLGIISTLVVLVGVPVGIGAYERGRSADKGRLIELTGVMKAGVWTDERVTAVNYAFGTYRRAVIVATVGEQVTLRLTSADVTHSFYVPELGMPVTEVYPGTVVELALNTERAGTFTYYCTSVCGKCHHFMRGLIHIVGPGEEPPAIEEEADAIRAGLLSCPIGAPPSPSAPLVKQGAYLYQTKGCRNCHGDGGRGGISNPNSLKGEVPALDELAERMFLFEKEDCDVVTEMLAQGEDPASLDEDDQFPRYAAFVTQYTAIRNVIKNGNPAAKKDKSGLEPPLQMPAWGQQLEDREVDALLVHLLEQFEWDDEEEE